MADVKDKIYSQYLSEQKRYKRFVPILRYFGYSMLILYLILLFTQKGLPPKFFLLNIYSIYCNMSLFIIYEYYKVPTIFQNLFSHDEEIVKESYWLINSKRNEIYQNFLIELYGKNYKPEQLSFDLDEIKKMILSLERSDWKKIGKIYFTVFLIVSLLLFYLLLPDEVI